MTNELHRLLVSDRTVLVQCRQVVASMIDSPTRMIVDTCLSVIQQRFSLESNRSAYKKRAIAKVVRRARRRQRRSQQEVARLQQSMGKLTILDFMRSINGS